MSIDTIQNNINKLSEEVKTLISSNNQKAYEKITLKCNPNPNIVIFIVIIFMIICYFMYVYFMEPSLTGKWKDSDNIIYDIKHQKIKDKITIITPYDKTAPNTASTSGTSNTAPTSGTPNIAPTTDFGALNKNLLIMDSGKIGIYLNDRIKWVDNKIWYKVA